jgi:hypothetical protein
MHRENGPLTISSKLMALDGHKSDHYKVLYGEIQKFSKKKGYCSMKNKTFGGLHGVTARTIRRWLKALLGLKVIVIKYPPFPTTKFEDGTSRRIFIVY